jgi:hypothetical protein
VYLKSNKKVSCPAAAVQATRGRGQLLLVLDLVTRWRLSGQRHTTAVLYARERTSGTHWIGGEWASELVWTQRLEEKSFATAADRTPVAQSPGCPVCSQTLYGVKVVRFQVLTVASMKVTNFCDMGPCSRLEIDRYFRVVYCPQINIFCHLSTIKTICVSSEIYMMHYGAIET